MAGFIFFAVENIIQPSVIGGLVLHYAQQKGIVRVPKYILGNFENQNVVRVIILNILQLEFWWLDGMLPRVRP